MKTKLLLANVVLKLNAMWQPLGYITVKDAFTKMFNSTKMHDRTDAVRPLDIVLTPDGAISDLTRVVDSAEWLTLPVLPSHSVIHRPHGLAVRVPLVVIAIGWKKHREVKLAVNKRGLHIRDNGQCCYCRKLISLDEGTNDHVIPRSRGGKTSWDNCVLACAPCNGKKGNRTPAEAGMTLMTRPTAPRSIPMLRKDSPPEHVALLKAA